MKTNYWAMIPPLLIFALQLVPSLTSAQTWDGGGDGVNWTDPLNWDTDTVPSSFSTVNIGAGATVDFTGSLPGGPSTINVDGTLNGGGSGAIRLSGATLNVSSTGSLTGGFWDLNGATLNFQDGAAATFSNWENKAINNFNFELGSTGFSTLTPGTVREGVPPAITTTFTADLANYTGPIGLIDLVDFSADAVGYTDADFIYNIINPGPYTANLQYDETGDIVQLNITATTAVPEPGSLGVLGLAILGLVTRRRRRQS